MPQLTLYIDTEANQLLSALNKSQTRDVSSLPLFYPDTIQLQIYLMKKVQVQEPSTFPYEIVSAAGLALELEISDGKADSDRTVYASQYVWSADANGQYFYANLSLNTAGIKTLVLGTEPNSAQAWLKIAYVQGGAGQTDVFSKQITIGIGVGAPLLVVPPTQTPLSREVADQLYVPFDGKAGDTITLRTPNGKSIILKAVDLADGTAGFDASPGN